MYDKVSAQPVALLFCAVKDLAGWGISVCSERAPFVGSFGLKIYVYNSI